MVEVLPEDLEAYFLEIPGCSLRAIVGRRVDSDLDGAQAPGNQSVPYTLKQFPDSTSVPISLRIRRSAGAGPGVAIHAHLHSEEEDRLAKKREKNREKQARWRERQRAIGKWAKRPKLTSQHDMGQMASPLLIADMSHEALTILDGHQSQMPRSVNASLHTEDESQFRNAILTPPPTRLPQPKQEEASGGTMKHIDTSSLAESQPALGVENMIGHLELRPPFRPPPINEEKEVSAVLEEGEPSSVACEEDVSLPHANQEHM